MKERIVLGYAGGAGIADVIEGLADAHGAEVVTLTLDLGQGRDLEAVRDAALGAGAVRAHVLDARDEFARDFALRALQAGVTQGRSDSLAAALAQPLVARKLVEIATIEAARSIAHGGTRGSRTRLNASLAALDARTRVLGVPRAAWSPYEGANLWGGINVAMKQPETIFDATACVEVAIDRGVPVAINGVPMALTELIDSLAIIGGRHGIGRTDTAAHGSGAGWGDERPGHVYEAPAAVILHAAHRALEKAVLPPELIRIQADQAATYAALVYSGQWFSRAREALDVFNAEIQQVVTGSVRITLSSGELRSSSIVERGEAVSLS